MSAMSELDAVLSGRTPEELFLLRGAIDDRIYRATLPEIQIVRDNDPDDPEPTELQCPICTSTDLAEIDTSTRHNELGEVEEDQGAIEVTISQGDAEFETLCYYCESCGSILALPDNVDVDVEWS